MKRRERRSRRWRNLRRNAPADGAEPREREFDPGAAIGRLPTELAFERLIARSARAGGQRRYAWNEELTL